MSNHFISYLSSVKEDHDELSKLHLGEVFLPPEVGAHLRAQASKEVVGVHDGVHESVHESHESDVPA